MSDSAIEWTGKVWNFLIGCDKVSRGCKKCYAIGTAWIRMHNPKMNGKFDGTVHKTAGGQLNWTGQINIIDDLLTLPFTWTKPDFVFVNSLSDLFHHAVPEAVLDRAFAVMGLTDHTYQILTKRPERMEAYWGSPLTINRIMGEMDRLCCALPKQVTGIKYQQARNYLLARGCFPNVWLGVSVEDQKAADGRIPHLLRTRAAVRFLSCEPLVGAVDLSAYLNERGFAYNDHIGLDWVICGGESGPGAEPMHPGWARTLRDQCAGAGVAFFFKQWGGWAFRCQPEDADELIAACNTYPKAVWFGPRGETVHANWECVLMERVGKAQAGRLLDGREHNAMPERVVVTPS